MACNKKIKNYKKQSIVYYRYNSIGISLKAIGIIKIKIKYNYLSI